MGHDHHFLSRLDRVSRDDLDLALNLYRDHERTAWILTRADPRGTSPRVALALGTGDKPPHVVVARSGHFVTCLGAGMSVGELPVISRGQLDHWSAEWARAREHEALRKRIVAERRANGASDNIFERLFHAGPSLSRDEFLAASAFSAMLLDPFEKALIQELKAFSEWWAQMRVLHARTRKASRLSSLYRPQLEIAARSFWGMQHTLVIYGMHVREGFELVPERTEPVSNLLLDVVRYGGLLGSLARTAWVMGKIGKAVFPLCKKRWDTAQSGVEILAGATSLCALGLRHQRLLADAKRALASPRTEGSVGFAKGVSEVALRAFDPETVEKRCAGRSFEAVIDQDLGALAVSEASLYEQPGYVLELVELMPFLARAEAEHLYLPRDLAREHTFTPDDCWSMLAKQYEAMRPDPPEKPVTARGAACPCGSGKKYKRCCGAD